MFHLISTCGLFSNRDIKPPAFCSVRYQSLHLLVACCIDWLVSRLHRAYQWKRLGAGDWMIGVWFIALLCTTRGSHQASTSHQFILLQHGWIKLTFQSHKAHVLIHIYYPHFQQSNEKQGASILYWPFPMLCDHFLFPPLISFIHISFMRPYLILIEWRQSRMGGTTKLM